MAGYGEQKLVDAFNALNEHGTPVVAYRLKQSLFRTQLCDVIVDSPNVHLAIEVKSLNAGKGRKALYRCDFQPKQLERMVAFSERAGREPWLCVVVRNGRGRRVKMYALRAELAVALLEQYGSIHIDEISKLAEVQQNTIDISTIDGLNAILR